MRARRLGVAALTLLGLGATSSTALADWLPLTNQPTFVADTALLLTDGTVMVHALASARGFGSSSWYKLTPDIDGSYLDGTWSAIAPLPSTYAPLYFESAVLPDGRVSVEGGEYNLNGQAETTLGALYDPVANTWTTVAPPTGWGSIGDAPGIVLPGGTLLLGDSQTASQALFNPTTLTWTSTGTGKAASNSEAGFTLLPSGKVLTIDVVGSPNAVELYDPATGAWTGEGATGVSLVDASEEIGPAILRPDGTVFATGATGNTAIYHPATSTTAASWTPGPTFPTTKTGAALDLADGAAALLPSGDVLCVASPGDYLTHARAFVFDGTKLIPVASPAGSTAVSSYNVRLLLLPTGEVLALDNTTQAQIYASKGTYHAAWAPEITHVATSLKRGQSYPLFGHQLNGLSQAVAYGDDAQMATNYPLVRITNVATGHVFYARTHGHSSMGVATGKLVVSTTFDVATGTETGPSLLSVVANGIPSVAVNVTIH